MAHNLVSIGRRERSFNINVGSFSETKKHSEKARWICIYPAYLNSKKSIAEGRKIPDKLAVENPTCNEIKDVLVAAGFNVEFEGWKVFPRELLKYENTARGRIRVQLKNDDGTPVNEQYKDSKCFRKFHREHG
jgi:signal recognition particle subunit SRP19